MPIQSGEFLSRFKMMEALVYLYFSDQSIDAIDITEDLFKDLSEALVCYSRLSEPEHYSQAMIRIAKESIRLAEQYKGKH